VIYVYGPITPGLAFPNIEKGNKDLDLESGIG